MAINITKNLKKPYWERRIHKDNLPQPPRMDLSNNYYYPKGYAEYGMEYKTQEDFMDELSPDAHNVNSNLVSRRPIYQEDGTDDKGHTKWKIVGYDKTEKVALGLPFTIAHKKAAHFGDFWVANETTKAEPFDKMMSWLDSSGLKVGYMESVLHTLKTGDAALYVYVQGGDIRYQVFSKLKGDTLYVQMDEERKPVIYRQYCINGRPAVDIISTRYYETWAQVGTGEEKKVLDWKDAVKTWFKKADFKETSEDGYTLLSRTSAQVSSDFNQCIYFRVDDVPWGVAKSSIDSLERALSYVAEDVKSNAFPMLFLKATKITALPPIGSHSRVIGAKGTAEEIAHADVKTINAGDMSNIAEVQLKTLAEDITHTTMTVFIDPEVLKSGADSSTTIKIMFAPEIQWCKTMWPQFYPHVKDLIEVFKQLVGKMENNIGDFAGLRVSIGNEVWIPQNEKEMTDIVVQKVYAGVLSEKNARIELGNQYLDDYEQTKKEREEKLYRDNYIPTTAKAQAQKDAGVSVEGNEANTEEEGNTSAQTEQQNAVNQNIVRGGVASQHIDNRSSNKNIATQAGR